MVSSHVSQIVAFVLSDQKMVYVSQDVELPDQTVGPTDV